MKKNIVTTLLGALLVSAASANNVSAQISSNDLNIQGDSLNNNIRVTRTATGVRVQGLNGTLVNGLGSVSFVTGPLVNVSILLDGGNDTVVFTGVNGFGDINVEGGQGNDLLNLSNINFNGNVNMKGEEGNDRAVIRTVRAAGDIGMDLGQGANSLLAQSSTSENFTAIGGEGVDRFDFGSLAIRGSLEVSSDKGSDVINVAGVQASLSANFNLDEGLDRLSASNVGVGLDFSINAGPQNDTVLLSGIQAAFNIGITLDDGNDMLRTSNVVAQADAIAIGGAGTDTLQNFGFLGIIKTEIVEFP